MERRSLTIDKLRELLDFDPETGVFTWRSVGSGRVMGQPAGTAWKNGARAYRTITIEGVAYQAPALAWFHHYGEWPPSGKRVKFKDRDQLNLCIDNLRLALTKKEHDALFHERNPEAERRANLSRYEGMSLEEYARMLLEQKGVCKGCGLPETATRNGKVRQLCVDHCHRTGKVRALLWLDATRHLDTQRMIRKFCGLSLILQRKRLRIASSCP